MSATVRVWLLRCWLCDQLTRRTAALVERLGQWWCGARGHEFYLGSDGTRVFLVCVRCHRTTPGWPR